MFLLHRSLLVHFGEAQSKDDYRVDLQWPCPKSTVTFDFSADVHWLQFDRWLQGVPKNSCRLVWPRSRRWHFCTLICIWILVTILCIVTFSFFLSSFNSFFLAFFLSFFLSLSLSVCPSPSLRFCFTTRLIRHSNASAAVQGIVVYQLNRVRLEVRRSGCCWQAIN